MIVTLSIIRNNPYKLFLVEEACLSRPTDCYKEENQETNTVGISTKWYCCMAEHSLFYDWQIDKIQLLWEDELALVRGKRAKYEHFIVSDDFGLKWALLDRNAPNLLHWMKQQLLTI